MPLRAPSPASARRPAARAGRPARRGAEARSTRTRPARSGSGRPRASPRALALRAKLPLPCDGLDRASNGFGGETAPDPRRCRSRLRAQGLPHLTRRRHRRRGGRRARPALPLLLVEGRGARDDLPRELGRAARAHPRGRGGATSPRREQLRHVAAILLRTLAAHARRRARARARDRAQPGGAGPHRRAREADRGDPAHHRARPGGAASSAPTSTRRSPRSCSTAASTSC